MGTVTFTLRAERDLNDIRDCIARDNPKAASGLTAAIERTCRLLADNPAMGRCDDLAARLRSFRHGKHAISDRAIRGGVEIVRIVRGARNVASLF